MFNFDETTSQFKATNNSVTKQAMAGKLKLAHDIFQYCSLPQEQDPLSQGADDSQ